MIQESEVRDRLARVVQGELSLFEFENWIEGESWSMHSDSSPQAVDLVSSIHLLLSERDDGLIDEGQLRHEFLELLTHVEEDQQ